MKTSWNDFYAVFPKIKMRLPWSPPAAVKTSIYAVACRAQRTTKRWRVEAWEHELALGQPLPTLPLWLNEQLFVPVELETGYEETCRALRIA